MSDIRSFLSRATRERHTVVDRLFSLDEITREDGYARMLSVHGRIVPVLETVLQQSGHLDDLPDAADRWRSDALVRDLARLGIRPAGLLDMSFFNASASAAGILYVLEGSRLGARMIVQHLRRAGLTDLPTEFLEHGSEKRHWQSFLGWLNGRIWSERELDLMRTAAEAVFDAYIHTAGSQMAPRFGTLHAERTS